MITSLFSAPTWVWTALIAAAVLIPILIHLINLWRYRRVKWAAMEFLLKSIRKKQKRVWLTQILLILNRILILFLALLLFAQVGFQGDEFGSTSGNTLHIVIVDDSYSMGQTQLSDDETSELNTKQQTCFDNARQAALNLVRTLAEKPNQSILLLRTSIPFEEQSPAMVECDSNAESLVNNFFADGFSDAAASPFEWLNRNRENIPPGQRLLIISDARANDLEYPEASTTLQELRQEFEEITLVKCSDSSRTSTNLYLSRLEPLHTLTSAGVPFYLMVEGTNPSNQPRRNVEIKLRKTMLRPSVDEVKVSEETTLLIPEILPGKSVGLQVPILIHQPGQVAFEAELADDELPTDNILHRIVDIRIATQVLLIAEPDNQAARYLKWIFEPRHQGSLAINSGFQVETKTAAEISQAGFAFEPNQIVFLLSDDLGNNNLVRKLENFVEDGGQLFWLPGQFADIQMINQQLFQNGKGILSFPLEAVVDMPERPNDIEHDFQFLEPNLVQSFSGESQKLLSQVQIFRKFIPPRTWNPTETETQVLAEVRGRATTPLILKSRYGQGSVTSILTSFDENWTNWPRNPTFLILIYRLLFWNAAYDEATDAFVTDKIPERAQTLLNQLDSTTPIKYTHSSQFSQFKTSRFQQLDLQDWKIPKRGIYFLERDNAFVWFTAGIDNRDSSMQVANDDEIESSLSFDSDSIVRWNESQLTSKSSAMNIQVYWWLLLATLLLIEQILAYKLGFHQGREGTTTNMTGSLIQRRRHG